MYATSYEQKQITHDCFNGNREQDCSICPAHHSRVNGICCFGDDDKYDCDDEDCQKCPFEDDCSLKVAEIVAEKEQKEIEKQAIYQGYQRKRTYSAYKAPSAPARPVQIGGNTQRPRIINHNVVAELSESETLFQRFLKDSIWGAGLGFFEMAAQFFRTFRLP